MDVHAIMRVGIVWLLYWRATGFRAAAPPRARVRRASSADTLDSAADVVAASPNPSPDGAAGVDMFGTPVAADGTPMMVPDDDDSVARAGAPLAPDNPVGGGDTAAPTPERTYTPADFVGSEWKLGVLWRGDDKIEVTWARCLADGSAEFGWGTRGSWRLDEGRFLTFAREFPLGWNGKRLFSAKVGDDPDFVEGIVRGWKPFESASVMGQWQAIRLGVERKGVAPWWRDSKINK